MNRDYSKANKSQLEELNAQEKNSGAKKLTLHVLYQSTRFKRFKIRSDKSWFMILNLYSTYLQVHIFLSLPFCFQEEIIRATMKKAAVSDATKTIKLQRSIRHNNQQTQGNIIQLLIIRQHQKPQNSVVTMFILETLWLPRCDHG